MLLSLVIPVYNEGEPFLETLRALDSKMPRPFEALVIYDMDEDTTVAPARRYAAGRDDIRLVKNVHGRGATQAIRTGFEQAKGDAVLVTMADLSDDYDKVPAMMNALEAGADLVCGSRYMAGGSQEGGPLIKSALSRLAGLSLYFIGALPVHDATNSFKLYRRSLLQRTTIESDTGFTIGFEILVKAHEAGARIVEIPTSWRERTTGRSRFRVFGWAPAYLRWYRLALFGRRAG